MTQLEKALLPDKAIIPGEHLGSIESRIFAISGMGGIGKTQLAAEFALSHLEHFDAVFWLHADNTSKLAKDFGDISIALSLEKVANDQAVSKDLVLDWLSGPSSGKSAIKGATSGPKWLLIFDNVDDPEVVDECLPVSGNGSILVTSRQSKVYMQKRFRTAEGFDLGPLSNVELEYSSGLLQTIIRVKQMCNCLKK